MQKEKQGKRFWLGNAVLAVALLMLFMGSLWQHLGVWAMGLWAAIVGAGTYLVMTDKGDSPKDPE